MVKMLRKVGVKAKKKKKPLTNQHAEHRSTHLLQASNTEKKKTHALTPDNQFQPTSEGGWKQRPLKLRKKKLGPKLEKPWAPPDNLKSSQTPSQRHTKSKNASKKRLGGKNRPTKKAATWKCKKLKEHTLKKKKSAAIHI